MYNDCTCTCMYMYTGDEDTNMNLKLLRLPALDIDALLRSLSLPLKLHNMTCQDAIRRRICTMPRTTRDFIPTAFAVLDFVRATIIHLLNTCV